MRFTWAKEPYLCLNHSQMKLNRRYLHAVFPLVWSGQNTHCLYDCHRLISGKRIWFRFWLQNSFSSRNRSPALCHLSFTCQLPSRTPIISSLKLMDAWGEESKRFKIWGERAHTFSVDAAWLAMTWKTLAVIVTFVNAGMGVQEAWQRKGDWL